MTRNALKDGRRSARAVIGWFPAQTKESALAAPADVLVVRRADNLHALSVYVGGTSREVAEFIADALNKERFAPKREAATNRRK